MIKNPFIKISLLTLAIFTLCCSHNGKLKSRQEPVLDPTKIKGFHIVYSPLTPPPSAQVGMVVCYDRKHQTLYLAADGHDTHVYGVVVADSGAKKIAIGGEVDVLVDRAGEDIVPGDWVVTSPATGRIMRVSDNFPLNPVVLGAALTGWKSSDSTQTIRVLLTPGEKIMDWKSRGKRSE